MTVGMIRPIALSRLSHEFLSVMISLGVTRPCTGAWCTTFYQRYPTARSLACKSLPGTRGAGHPRHCEREDHHRLTRFYSISTLLKWYRASSVAWDLALSLGGGAPGPNAHNASAAPSR